MIPKWKLQRELTRLKVQISGAASELYAPVQRARHDRERETRVRTAPGAAPLTGKLAAILIYQPGGVPLSLLQTLDHLKSQGYAVLAISNAPLATDDREAIAARVWQIAERPNFGYDFGGYRDAVWLLGRLGVDLDTLILMNDSVWFPIRAGDSMLAQMEGTDADFQGAQVFGRAEDPEAFEARRNPMFGSYFLFFKRPAVGHPAFRDFWRDYRMSSNKELTLRRGERAFSRALMTSGLTSRGLFSQPRFRELVERLAGDDLALGIKYLICLDETLEAERRKLADGSGPDWADRARDLILRAAASKNYIGSSPVLSIRHLGFPMIKKNRERLYTRARAAIVSAIDAGDLDPLDPVVETELRARVAELSG